MADISDGFFETHPRFRSSSGKVASDSNSRVIELLAPLVLLEIGQNVGFIGIIRNRSESSESSESFGIVLNRPKSSEIVRNYPKKFGTSETSESLGIEM